MRLLVMILAAVALMACAACADTVIYSGQPAAAAGITLGHWGTGSAEDSNSKALGGPVSIKVTTGGWFQGGSIEFKNPVALPIGKPESKDYFVFTIAPTVQSSFTTRPDGTWYPRGGGVTGAYDLGTEPMQLAKIEKLRLVLIDALGKRAEIQHPPIAASDSGWLNVSLPLAKIKLPGASADVLNLKKILVFSDVPDTIYIGQINVKPDSEPINADLGGDLSYAVNDSVPLKSNPVGGLSALKVVWDFDGSDGIQEDALGEYVTHVFKTSGDYVVTATLTDIDGIKSPLTKTVKVHIE